jgi:hypothetical protein
MATCDLVSYESGGSMNNGEGLVLTGARWFSVKWWGVNHRTDLAERAALSVETLRKAGFIARIAERGNQDRAEVWKHHPEWGHDTYAGLIRVEVYGATDVHERAKHHLRGFWAALDSRGMPQDYRIGYSTGVAVMQNVAAIKPDCLPTATRKTLKA